MVRGNENAAMCYEIQTFTFLPFSFLIHPPQFIHTHYFCVPKTTLMNLSHIPVGPIWVPAKDLDRKSVV